MDSSRSNHQFELAEATVIKLLRNRHKSIARQA
ncbi:MAG: hypothetical protein ACI9AX_000689 [Polaromonas sp.]|jgi:hypothetical protein